VKNEEAAYELWLFWYISPCVHKLKSSIYPAVGYCTSRTGILISPQRYAKDEIVSRFYFTRNSGRMMN